MITVNAYFIMSPLIGALIGYFTNWVAIKMLFKPYDEKRFFGIRIPFTPGLIPKRRYLLAKKTARTITERLLTDETLIDRFCAASVKNGAKLMLDGFFESALKSEKTLGQIFFKGENESAPLNDIAPEFFRGEEMRALAQKLDERLFNDGKKISGFLGESLCANAKIWVSANIPAISERLLTLVTSDFFKESLKPLAIDVINQNIKGFASLFVVAETVYANFLDGVRAYFENPENYDVTEAKLIAVIDVIKEAEISEIARAVSTDDGRLFAFIIEKILAAQNEQGLSKLAETVLLTEVGKLMSVIGQERLEALKNAAMSRYEPLVKSVLPRVLEAVGLSDMIEAKINDFEMKEAEEIIVSVVDRELKAITYFGGLLGFIIGLVPPVLQKLGV